MTFFEFWPQHFSFYPKSQSAEPVLLAHQLICWYTKFTLLKYLTAFWRSISMKWTLSGRESMDFMYQILGFSWKMQSLISYNFLSFGNQITNQKSGITSSSSSFEWILQILRISKLSQFFSGMKWAQFAVLACAPAYRLCRFCRFAKCWRCVRNAGQLNDLRSNSTRRKPDQRDARQLNELQSRYVRKSTSRGSLCQT